MTAIDTILFEQFADALNSELVAIAATLRVARDMVPPRGMMMLQDAAGHLVGPVPDYADAATIKAIEAMLDRRDRLRPRP